MSTSITSVVGRCAVRSSASTARWRRRLRRRRPRIEPLEPRRLLALTNAGIGTDQEQALLDGLDGLAQWSEMLDDYEEMAQSLPVIGQSVGETFDLGGLLDESLAQEVADYFDGDLNPTTDELVTALGSLSHSSFTITTSNVTGGLDTAVGDGELIFNLVLQADRSFTTRVSLGPQGDELGIVFDYPAISVAVDAQAVIDFAFGFDMASGLADDEAFFIRVNDFDMTIDVASQSLSSGPMNAGFFDATLQSGTMALDVDVDVALANPDSDAHGRITLKELETPGDDISSLVTLTPTGSASGNIAVLPGSFTGFSYTGSPAASFSTSDPFDPPDIAFTDFDELLNFSQLNAFSLMGSLSQLGGWWNQLGGTSVMDTSAQLAGDARLGDILGLGQFITDTDIGLFAGLLTTEDPPRATFDSAQSFSSVLQSALGLTPAQVDAQYDAVDNELTYHLIIDETSTGASLPLGFDLDLSPLVEIDTSAQVDVEVSGQLEMTIGFNLDDLRADLVGSSAAPTNGQLSGDANFSLSIGGGTAVPVTVPTSATGTNANLNDLVVDFNNAFVTANIDDQVEASVDAGNHLVISTKQVAILPLIQLSVASSDPMVTDLHFIDGQVAVDSLLSHTFIEDASASATATLDAPDIDASADFGFAEVSVVDGTAEADISISLDVADPATSTPGGRIYIAELFAGLTEDVDAIVVDVNLSGSLDVRLPLTATLLGVANTGNPEIVVSWPDITTGTPDVQFNDAEQLLRFGGVDFTTFENTFSNIAQFLAQMEQFSFLNEEIPGINMTIADLAKYADGFLQSVLGIENDTGKDTGGLNQLEGILEEAFGLEDEELELSMVDDNKVLKIELSLGADTNTQVPLNFDLGELGLGELGNLVDVHGSGLLNAQAGVTFDLDVGIDLEDKEDPQAFLFDTTQLELGANVTGTDIEFTTALGPLGIFVAGGELTIDGDGDPDTTADKVTLAAELIDNDDDIDGRIYLSDLDLDNVDMTFGGQVFADLPVFFPTQTRHIGSLGVTITDLSDIENTITVTTPDFDLEFDQMDILNDLGVVLDGIDIILGGVQDVLDGEVFGVRLPLIGEGLDDAVEFIDDVRTGFLGELRARFQEARGNTGAAVQQALFDALGPDGLNLLDDRDSSGDLTPDDVIVTLADWDEDGNNDQIQFDFTLAAEFEVLEESIDFDIGLPALGLEVEGDVELGIGFEWKVGFGIDRENGFYLNTAEEDEMTVALRARIPDLRAQGRLAFLQLDVADEDADENPNNDGDDADADGRDPSEFLAGLVVDLHDPIDDEEDPTDNDKLSFADITSGELDFGDAVDASLVGEANLALDLDLSFQGDSNWPSISAELDVHWPFAETDPDLTGDTPTVAFNNVGISAGDVINDFIGSAVRKIRDLTEPLDPVLEFLTTPIPILVDYGIEITPIQMAEVFGYAEVTEFLEDLAGIIHAINTIPDVDDELFIPLGSFDLTGVDPREDDDLQGENPNPVGTPVDPIDELENEDPDAKSFWDELHDIGLYLPIIESPDTVFRLLMGQQVDLILYDMPFLGIDFPFPPIKIGPLIPPIPIFATFGGSVAAGIDLAFGFDTHGVEKYKETGDWWDVLAGFFISDTENPDGTGKDVPEATLTGEVFAGVELGLWVVSAGVSGGLGLTLGADLVDPNGDGKVHVDEFVDNLERGLTCTFSLTGELTAKLSAYVEFLFKRWTFDIFEVTIVDFELTDEDCFPDRFDQNDTLGSAIDIGIGPGQHLDGLAIESSGDEDWYAFELLEPDSIIVDVRHSNARGNIDLEVYDSSQQKIGEGNSADDREKVALTNLAAGTYYARVTGSGMLNNYKLSVEPHGSSDTRVIYVNPAGKEERDDSFYTLMPGNDNNDGLSPFSPQATLGGVLTTHELGPHDLIVFDTGGYAAATISAADSGATYVGTPVGSTLGGVTLDGAAASRFERLTFSGSTDMTFTDADNNLVQRVRFEGVNGVLIEGTSSGNEIRNSVFANAGTGLQVTGSGSNLIEMNTFAGSSVTGMHLGPGATATIRNNDISGWDVGVYTDSKVADVYDNDIHTNVIGVTGLVGTLGTDNPPPFGTAGGKTPNRVYGNATGVVVPEGATGFLVRFTEIFNNSIGVETYGNNTQIVANDIFGNDVGIQGTTIIGPADWGGDLQNLIHDNEVGVLAQRGAEVQYNRIYSNTTGVQVEDDALVHNNLIYRNTGHGVLLDGSYRVDVTNNTIYAPGGNGVHLADVVEDVTIRDNIIYAVTGTGLYVEPEAEFGYTSDYNNLYTGGAGSVAFQGKAFGDLYDWQVEAESDLHSIGYTTINATLDDPDFVDLGNNDYRLQSGSTSIDAGNPASDFSLEPSPAGGRVNLGAYGNTPLATLSTGVWLEILQPNFYVDLVPSRTYEIRWNSHNIPPGTNLDIDLTTAAGAFVADIATVPAAAGTTTWTPGNFVSGSTSARYRVELATIGAPGLLEASREPFAVPNVVPSAATTFYVNDRDTTNDQYTTAVGDNRNTGTTVGDPKVVMRPLVLSYALGAGDTVLVDNGNYVHAINLNLGGSALPFDPRMQTVNQTLITGPTAGGTLATIDRANPNVDAVAIDMIGAVDMTLDRVEVTGGSIGVRVRDGSTSFSSSHARYYQNSLDGLAVEVDSHGVELDNIEADHNDRHGVFVDSDLEFLTNAQAHDNGAIGIALRGVGDPVIETSAAFNNFRGIDVINPGAQQAVLGHMNLTSAKGNMVHDNTEDGIFASGNVLVVGNTLTDNGRYGIRLDDGADAHRNVTRNHVTGITARGSTSDIIENRSFINSTTGIEASFLSNVQRNVTYSNDLHGIHTDRFGGVIDHNLVYSTGWASINVEGPGIDADLINNTVYEPCAANPEEPIETHLGFDWNWNMGFEDAIIGPPPQGGAAWGIVNMIANPPVGDLGGTFDLGHGGASQAQTADPVPPGETFTIDLDLTLLGMTSTSPLGSHGEYSISLWASGPPETQSSGQIEVTNMGGWIEGTVTYSLMLEFAFQDGTQLVTETPYIVETTFDASAGLGEHDALRMAVPLLPVPGSPSVPLIEPGLPGFPVFFWDIDEGYSGGEIEEPEFPEPQDKGETCAEIGVLVNVNSERVLLRNNAIYVEAAIPEIPGIGPSADIMVTADSTQDWNSDFNVLMTKYGNIGNWAGTPAGTLAAWQSLSNDDMFSIDPPFEDVWVDEDGADNTLGHMFGSDDNFHLESPYGQAMQGALAPVEDWLGPGTTSLPDFLPVNWYFDPAPNIQDLSPAVDIGDPSYDYTIEPLENGKMINAGAYGNTVQASNSEPEYIHMVYPLGLEQLVPGRTYEIRWRSHDHLPTTGVVIELYHVDSNGLLEMPISPTPPAPPPITPNTGSFFWTVPSPPPPSWATDYVVVVKRPSLLMPGTDVIGESRLQFEIGSDTRPPQVLDTAPGIVERRQPTNASFSQITVTFSENLDPIAAGTNAAYLLFDAGPNNILGDGDDAPHVVTVNSYTAGVSDADTSVVVLDFDGGVPLPQQRYRLTIDASIIQDKATLSLDGDRDGAGGDNYTRDFRVDFTQPTVDITDVSPVVRKDPVTSIGLVFDEEVRGVGLSPLRLTRDGGRNLLDGTQQLTTSDHVTWTIPNLAGLTDLDGHYMLTLDAAQSNVVDLAGNPLANDDMIEWTVDTVPPRIDITPVAPDPRTTGVPEIGITFNEEVYDFTLSQLTLSRDGTTLSLATATLSTTDQIHWTLGNLGTITAVDGTYELMVDEESAAVHDLAGNTLEFGARESWQRDTDPPSGQILPPASPRNSAVDEVTVAFDEPVMGVTVGHFFLTRDGQFIPLVGTATLTTRDLTNWTVGNLSGVTALPGQYSLTMYPTGVTDLAGNPFSLFIVGAWTVDTRAPSVGIVDVSPDPRNADVAEVTIEFDEPVDGFTLAELSLTRDGGVNLLTAAQTLTTTDESTFVLGNLAGLTNVDGQYQLTLTTGGVTDKAGNALPVGDVDSFLIDTVVPDVDIIDVTLDPRRDEVNQISIQFTEPISGLDLSDLTLRLDGGANLLTGAQSVTTSDQQTWTLQNLDSITATSGLYELSLRAFGSGIVDDAGNTLPAGTYDDWVVLNPPSVVGRHVFYNNSAYDGNDSAVNAADDAAIATDKTALPLGQTATLANYTSYSRGINGVMVDIENPLDPGQLDADDFEFYVGNSNTVAGWAAAPAPQSVAVRAGDGPNVVHRVSITWADGAITNQWLRVVVKANTTTGLSVNDEFFFGNAIGETGNSATDALVTAADVVGIRDNPRGAGNRADVTNPFDLNRDRLVNAADAVLARNNTTSPFDALHLISPTLPSPPPLEAEGAAPSLPRDTLWPAPRTTTTSRATLEQRIADRILAAPASFPVEFALPLNRVALHPVRRSADRTRLLDEPTSEAPATSSLDTLDTILGDWNLPPTG